MWLLSLISKDIALLNLHYVNLNLCSLYCWTTVLHMDVFISSLWENYKLLTAYLLLWLSLDNFDLINKIFTKFKKVFKYYQQNEITRKVNEPILLVHECIRCSECNCTKIMHACYFLVFWVSLIQIGCSMCFVYAKCMNN